MPFTKSFTAARVRGVDPISARSMETSMGPPTMITVPFDKGWANPGGPEIQVPIPAGAEPA